MATERLPMERVAILHPASGGGCLEVCVEEGTDVAEILQECNRHVPGRAWSTIFAVSQPCEQNPGRVHFVVGGEER